MKMSVNLKDLMDLAEEIHAQRYGAIMDPVDVLAALLVSQVEWMGAMHKQMKRIADRLDRNAEETPR
jgi:hypothetical protein